MINLDLLDSHGLLNVLEEDWVNIKFDKTQGTPIVVGATFNNILRSLFLLHSQSASAMRDILGGVDCWENVEESLMCTILTFSTVREVTQRVYFLVLMYLEDPSLFDITYGALRLLYLWAAYYSIFITDLQLTELMVAVEEIYASKITKSYCKCNTLTVELRTLLHELTAARSSAVFSATPRLSTTFNAPGGADGPVVVSSTGPIPPVIAQLQGTWFSENLKANVDAECESNPDLDFHRGAGGGSDVGAAEAPPPVRHMQRKDTVVTKPKFEMFGMDGLNFDTDSDTSSVAPPPVPAAGTESAAMPTKPSFQLPTARIMKGFNLLQDHRFFTIWTFDLTEIARQWTLIDQSLFRAITLPCFLSCTWSEPRHSTKSAPAVRKFIDRFNAESIWATNTVLALETPAKRAERYQLLIELAEELLELNNYSGVTAIISSLQQSAISRLRQTLALVHEDYKDRLQTLATLMSGLKNYKNYREHLNARLAKMPEFSVKAITASGEEVKQENSGGTNAFARRSSIVVNKSLMTTPASSAAAAANDVRAAAAQANAEDEQEKQPMVGIVPHLGAHTAELTGVYEVTEFIPDSPCLINVTKKVMTTRCILQLARLQRTVYAIQSVRLVGNVINKSIQQHQYFSAADSAQASKDQYALSCRREP